MANKPLDLTGLTLRSCGQISSDEKVRMFLNGEVDSMPPSIAGFKSIRSRLAANISSGFETNVSSECDATWTDHTDSASLLNASRSCRRISRPSDIKKANTYYSESQQVGSLSYRQRGTYSPGVPTSSDFKGSKGEAVRRPHIDSIPSSPNSPGEVRFSWDFSEASDRVRSGYSSLNNSREGLRKSKEPTHLSGIVEASTKMNSLFRSDPQFPLPSTESMDDSRSIPWSKCNPSLSDDLREKFGQGEPSSFSSRTSLMQRPQRVRSEISLPGKRVTESEGSICPPVSSVVKKLAISKCPGDSVIEGLLKQLQNANDSASCIRIIERVLLFLASSMSQKVSKISGPMKHSGLSLLKATGSFVQRELSLVRCLEKIRCLHPSLLPPLQRWNDHAVSAKERWASPVNVGCFGEEPGSLGLGLILLFSWLNPALEVDLTVFSGSAEMKQIYQATPLGGISDCVGSGILDVLQTEGCLKGFRIVVLSHVIVKAMKEKRANDWALFWRDLHSATEEGILLLFCDDFQKASDFLLPQFVLSSGWRCENLDNASSRRVRSGSQFSAYIAWKSNSRSNSSNESS